MSGSNEENRPSTGAFSSGFTELQSITSWCRPYLESGTSDENRLSTDASRFVGGTFLTSWAPCGLSGMHTF